VRKIDLA